jgi:hypothetical protein
VVVGYSSEKKDDKQLMITQKLILCIYFCFILGNAFRGCTLAYQPTMETARLRYGVSLIRFIFISLPFLFFIFFFLSSFFFFLRSAQNAQAFISQTRMYGSYEGSGFEQFVWRSQFVNYENHKALFEGRSTSHGNALLMWMSQSCWPSMV